MLRFRLVKCYSKNIEDRITVDVDKEYLWELICVGILDVIEDISKDLNYIHQPTQNDTTVIKTLFKNNKGIYYTKRIEKGYNGKTARTYLTEDEIKGMKDFIEYVEK